MSRIETQLHAGSLAELDQSWRIVAHKSVHGDEAGRWVYIDRLCDHAEQAALVRARDLGSVVTVTRRELDGAVTLLAKLAEPIRWAKSSRRGVR